MKVLLQNSILFSLTHHYAKKRQSKTFKYTQSVTTIEENNLKTICHACRSLLIDKDNVWVKKDNPEFDVIMGSYDSAELSE